MPELPVVYPVREMSGYVFDDHCGLSAKPGPTAVVLPPDIETIDPKVFYFSSLREIRIENGLHYETVDGVLFHTETHTPAAYPYGKPDLVCTVPEGTQVIGSRTFYLTKYLREVHPAESVRTVRKGSHPLSGRSAAGALIVMRSLKQFFPGKARKPSATILSQEIPT